MPLPPAKSYCCSRGRSADSYLLNGDHLGVEVDSVECKAKGLAVAKPGDRTKQDKSRVAAGHGIGRGEHLGGGQQPDHSAKNLRPNAHTDHATWQTIRTARAPAECRQSVIRRLMCDAFLPADVRQV